MFSNLSVVIVISSLLVHLVFSCTHSPQDWCSTRKIARDCQVELQCEKFVWERHEGAYFKNETTSNNDEHYFEDEKVQLGFYYESLCPDCQKLFATQLIKTYKALSSIMDLDLVPYGNAQEIWDSDKWVFLCQHGESECHGNIIHTCALDLYPFNVTFHFIACTETTRTSAEECAKKYGLDIDKLENCASSSHGNQLEHKMADKTANLSPPHEYVPWITVNRQHTDAIQSQAENDMIQLVCSAYKGSKKPSACDGKERKCKKN